MTTTAMNIDKTARTAHEMAEAQRDSFEAIAENFAAAQRRSIGIAEGGLEFMRLQEQNARAAQEFFANGVRLLQLQQRNAEFVQGWMGDAVEVVREQTDKVLRQTEKVTREAELRTAVLAALETIDYEGLTVEEVSKRIEGLPTEQLKKVREFEKNHKNRETLIEQIDRKIRANENS